jgi:hypothetical protein
LYFADLWTSGFISPNSRQWPQYPLRPERGQFRANISERIQRWIRNGKSLDRISLKSDPISDCQTGDYHLCFSLSGIGFGFVLRKSAIVAMAMNLNTRSPWSSTLSLLRNNRRESGQMCFVTKAGEIGSRESIEGCESEVHGPKGRQSMSFNSRCPRKQQNLLSLEKCENLNSFCDVSNGLAVFKMPVRSCTDRARTEGTVLPAR